MEHTHAGVAGSDGDQHPVHHALEGEDGSDKKGGLGQSLQQQLP